MPKLTTDDVIANGWDDTTGGLLSVVAYLDRGDLARARRTAKRTLDEHVALRPIVGRRPQRLHVLPPAA